MTTATDEEFDYVSHLIHALSRMESSRGERRSAAPGLWLLTVRSIAWALIVEASAQHEVWSEEAYAVGVVPSVTDRDVIANVRRLVLGEEVSDAPVSVNEVLFRMGFLGLTGPGGGGS